MRLEEKDPNWLRIGLMSAAGVACLAAASMWGCPQYAVYEQKLHGEAELARAGQNRNIAILEANAKRDSAVALAEAEVARAEGVARANKIIGDSLKGNESYLRYLWIHNLDNPNTRVIYVPTEANLPILEAGARK